MEPYPIRLPAQVYERSLPRLIATLAATPPDRTPVLDFAAVKYWIPAAVTATCAMVRGWHLQGRTVQFLNHGQCDACGYLQRIDFFHTVGLDLPDPRNRHAAGFRFVPIREVGVASPIGMLPGELASCVAETDNALNDAYQLTQYAAGELVNNCRQHAGAPGFVSAQYSPGKDRARIGMADCGIGIRRSFLDNGSPHVVETHSDAEAIKIALRPLVSSKTHRRDGPYGAPVNMGLGLSMVSRMVAATLGEMVIISGNAWWYQDAGKEGMGGELSGGCRYPGTVLSAAFLRDQVGNFGELLTEARGALGLTGGSGAVNVFK